MRCPSLRTFIIAVAAVVAAGCASDSPVAPTSAAKAPAGSSQQSLVGTLLGTPQTVNPLLRTTPLASNITASTRVGLLGGSINIPAAGLSIVIPPLAAPLGTVIKVTALAGNKVAYEFEPHGLHFLLPLVALQNLHNVQTPAGGLLDLGLGYFPDATNVTSITELLNVNVDLLGLTATTTIWHFSGYVFVGGRSAIDDGSY
jgi:hypothetical protein